MIKKFWLGQTPMWFTFWILGVLFFKVFYYGLTFGLSALGADVFLMLDIIGFILLPLTLFWAVGTWRSATYYKGSKLWSILTEIYIVISIGSVLFSLYLQFTN